MLHVALFDNRRMRILKVDLDGALIEIQDVGDANALTHERDYKSDRPGRVISAATGAHVTFSPRHSARAIELKRWLKWASQELMDVLDTQHSDGVVLVASARLMGLLHLALPVAVRRQIVAEVARDLIKHPPTALERRLRPVLQEAAGRVRRRPVSTVATRHRMGD